MEKNFLNITPESGNGNQEVHRDLIFTGSREKLYKHGNSRKN